MFLDTAKDSKAPKQPNLPGHKPAGNALECLAWYSQQARALRTGCELDAWESFPLTINNACLQPTWRSLVKKAGTGTGQSNSGARTTKRPPHFQRKQENGSHSSLDPTSHPLSPEITVISEAFTPKEGPLFGYSCHMASPSKLGGGESLLGVPAVAFQSTGHKNITGSSWGPPALCNLIIFIPQGLAQVLLHFVVAVITILNVLTFLCLSKWTGSTGPISQQVQRPVWPRNRAAVGLYTLGVNRSCLNCGDLICITTTCTCFLCPQSPRRGGGGELSKWMRIRSKSPLQHEKMTPFLGSDSWTLYLQGYRSTTPFRRDPSNSPESAATWSKEVAGWRISSLQPPPTFPFRTPTLSTASPSAPAPARTVGPVDRSRSEAADLSRQAGGRTGGNLHCARADRTPEPRPLWLISY